jgi:hypothetical protein
MAKRMPFFIGCLIAALSGSAPAEPYWVAYEGNDFPENEGWGRVTSGGGAERTIQDGILIIDGLRSVAVNDLYGRGRQPFDPGPGEVFRADWRLGIDQVIGVRDPGFAIFSQESWAVVFSWSTTFIRSEFEAIDIPYQTSEMHEYSVVSSDMRNYQLFADGVLLHEGQFFQVFGNPHVRWGDGVQGAASLSRWDYVRFGVVPEPRTMTSLGVLLVTLRKITRRSND